MNRITSQIALIAYLMGGWLLPAIHHHGDSCTHASHAACELNDGIFSHIPHNHRDDDHDSCSHGHDRQVSDDVDRSIVHHPILDRSNNQHTIVYGHQTWVCDGLCALCVARTLTTTQSDHFHVTCADEDAAGAQALHDLKCDLDPPEGCHSPRGPPQDLV